MKTAPTLSAFLALASLVCFTGCSERNHGHSHSEAHPTGHDHHAEGHGHGGENTVGTTLWSSEYELFGEHTVGMVGKPSSFLLHFTTLNDFSALQEAKVHLELSGPAPLSASANEALRPGIFQLEITPTVAGTYKGQLRVEGKIPDSIPNFEFVVYADEKESHAAAHEEEDDEGLIEFLKEQQWAVPFGTAFAEHGVVTNSVEVSGRVDTPPGGRAEIGASTVGRVIAPPEGLPRPGTSVTKGQVLATLQPAPPSPEGAARASLAVAEAEARVSAGKAAVSRAERLIADQAISQREVDDARRELNVANQAVRSAKRAAALYSGNGVGASSALKLRSPIDGILSAVHAKPGSTVSPGQSLFEIVDDRELWIAAKVPEQDAARLRTDRDASFRVTGLDTWQPIDITGDDATASIVNVGRVVEPHSRTVDLLYALNEPSASLRIGGLLQVSVPIGDEFEGVVIPRSGVVNLEGREVVYVQVDGEHFEERAVALGPRSGNWVGVKSGLEKGERIVTVGSHLVRLAEKSKGAPAHGHVH